MQSSKFVEAYPKDLSEPQIYRGNYHKEVRDAQEYSYMLGRFVHAVLEGEPPDVFTSAEEFDRYDAWTRGYHELEGSILQLGTLEPLNEVNFHGLNRHMLDLWKPLQEGWKSDAQRRDRMNFAQNSLALAGFGYYRLRERIKQRHKGTEYFFQEHVQPDYGRFTGMIQEYDAAIVLIDAIRHNPDLTVIPAPMQFERTNPQYNVDFIVVDCIGKRAVGVQVKTQVRHSHTGKYDAERVVLVDGNVDLDNVQVMRVKRGTSQEAPKPWPGIISAKRVDAIKTSGKKSRTDTAFSALLLNKKQYARQLVGEIKVDYKQLSNRIGKRILDIL